MLGFCFLLLLFGGCYQHLTRCHRRLVFHLRSFSRVAARAVEALAFDTAARHRLQYGELRGPLSGWRTAIRSAASFCSRDNDVDEEAWLPVPAVR